METLNLLFDLNFSWKKLYLIAFDIEKSVFFMLRKIQSLFYLSSANYAYF